MKIVDFCSATASPEAEKAERIQQNKEKGVPKPIVRIDNQHDPFATVVDIEYGNELGELLDTVGALLAKLQRSFPLYFLSGLSVESTAYSCMLCMHLSKL